MDVDIDIHDVHISGIKHDLEVTYQMYIDEDGYVHCSDRMIHDTNLTERILMALRMYGPLHAIQMYDLATPLTSSRNKRNSMVNSRLCKLRDRGLVCFLPNNMWRIVHDE